MLLLPVADGLDPLVVTGGMADEVVGNVTVRSIERLEVLLSDEVVEVASEEADEVAEVAEGIADGVVELALLVVVDEEVGSSSESS